MFHVSFLMNHHKVILSIGERGLFVLEVANRSRDQDNDDEEGESSHVEQAVISISQADWASWKRISGFL